MKVLIVVLLTGMLQMFLGHYFNLHAGLEHMQFTSEIWYVGESLAYSFGHWLMYAWVDNQPDEGYYPDEDVI